MNAKKILSIVLCLLLTVMLFAGCGETKEKVLIYTSIEDYVLEDLQACLNEKFPDYNIVIEYMSTGDHAAKLISEGANTACDITYDLEYPYLQKLDEKGLLANLTDIVDISVFSDDALLSECYIPHCRNGGSIILNTDVLKEKNLPEPTSYADLLNPIYKGFISMPNPKSSGTGFMFLMSLVNAMGEDEAFDYFDKLSENILQFTSSGSGPVNALLQGEAAIGLGMTSNAVVKIKRCKAVVGLKGDIFPRDFGKSVCALVRNRKGIKPRKFRINDMPHCGKQGTVKREQSARQSLTVGA